jgi:hypothetical protein
MLQNHLRLKNLGLLLCLLGIVGIQGCASFSEAKKVVIVQESDALFKIGPNVVGRLYFWNGKEWELSQNEIKLPEGWLTGPLNSTNKPK